MQKKSKFALVVASVTFLAACGGGGGGGSSGGSTVGGGSVGVSTASNPLQKYEGTYSICDVGGHSKQTITVTATGSNSVSMASTEQIYQNANCSGAIVGTYSLPSPITATYQSQTTASFPQVTIMPRSDTVESVTISAPAMTATLVGSGVSGSCVTYANGYQCFGNLAMSSQAFTAALYLRGNYFVTFDLQNGVLVVNGIFSKDPSFNFNMLISAYWKVTP